MRRALLAAAVALPALALGAPEQDRPAGPEPAAPTKAYLLRARYTPKVGDRVLVHEREKMKQAFSLKRKEDVLEEGKETSGFEQRYEREVQAVDAKGNVTRELRTYSHLRSFTSNERIDLDGLQVILVAKPDGTMSWTPASKKPVKVPKLLREALDEETDGTLEEDDAQDKQAKLLPSKAVALAETWAISLDAVAAHFGLPKAAIDRRTSSARGRLDSVRSVGGKTTLRVVLELKLRLWQIPSMSLARTPKPVRYDATIGLTRCAASPAYTATTRLEVRYDGPSPGKELPKGSALKFTLQVDNFDRREEVKQKKAGGS